MTEQGPVVLMSRSKPAAILLSPVYWDAIAKAMEAYQRQAESSESSPTMVATSDEYGDEEEIDAFAAIAALAQPLGPADLARNFDK